MLEAIAMEKPIITTDAPGCREVCFDGVNGFLVKPRDALCLAAAMEKVLNLSDEERINMGKEGRRIAVERFKADKVVDIYLREIEKSFYRNSQFLNETQSMLACINFYSQFSQCNLSISSLSSQPEPVNFLTSD